MITKDQALQHREFHFDGPGSACAFYIGERGGEHLTAMVVRASGRVQTWKRDPQRFRLPVKYGMYASGEITEHNAEQFHLPSECPALTARDTYRFHIDAGCTKNQPCRVCDHDAPECMCPISEVI